MFNLKEYWQNRYVSGGNSGAGSYGEEAKFKSEYINSVIKKYNIKSLVDYGCGDGNQLLYLNGFDKYYGYDIAPESINLCKKRMFNSEIYTFTSILDELDNNSDLGMTIDTLFHQIYDEDYFDLLNRIFNFANHKYVLLYTNNAIMNKTAEHVRHRKVIEDVKLITKAELIDTLNCSLSEPKHFLLYKNVTK